EISEARLDGFVESLSRQPGFPCDELIDIQVTTLVQEPNQLRDRHVDGSPSAGEDRAEAQQRVSPTASLQSIATLLEAAPQQLLTGKGPFIRGRPCGHAGSFPSSSVESLFLA